MPISVREFRNQDIPQIVRLWRESGLGRGAAQAVSSDTFEYLVFCQSYFDPAGLLIAVDTTATDLHADGEIVGFLHAGFGATAAEDRLNFHTGVICALVVSPAHRQQGIGKQLVHAAERFFEQRGASEIVAGQFPGLDPFYQGLYGGARPAGFLDSDAGATPFFKALGYQTHSRSTVLQRDLKQRHEPVSLRLMAVRRSSKLVVVDPEPPRSWWWVQRFTRLDSIDFALIPKLGGTPLASVTLVGLDAYVNSWNARAVGMIDLTVAEHVRRKGHAQALLIEVCRRLREESISLVDASVPAGNDAALLAFQSAGFRTVDSGQVLLKIVPNSPEPAA